jgi:hypothetical protein
LLFLQEYQGQETTVATTISIPAAMELAAALRDGSAGVTAEETALDVLNSAVMPNRPVRAQTSLLIRLGDWSLDLPVWSVAGWYDGSSSVEAGAKWQGGWQYSDSDGQFCGRPRVEVTSVPVLRAKPTVFKLLSGGERGVDWVIGISGGQNVSEVTLLEGTYAAHEAAEADAATIRQALDNAYDSISVPEPSDEDLVTWLSGEEGTYVTIDENGDILSPNRLDGLGITIRGAKLMGRHVYSIEASTDDPWDTEDIVYVGARAAAEAARELLATMLDDAAERVRSVPIEAIIPNEDN